MDVASSQGTVGLESAYDALKDQFKAVNRKLRDTNIKLSSKVGELDVLTYYLNSILSQISQGLLFINLDGYVTTCNATAMEMLEIDESTLLFQRFSDYFRDDFFGFSMKEALAKKSAPKKTFVAHKNSKGVEKELEIDATIVLQKEAECALFHHLFATDSLQGIIVLMRDITEMHRLQSVANRNDRMKALGEMAAMVAHEIRNPLGGIKGFASLLQRDLQDQPQLQQLASQIVEGTDNLNRLVTNVLNYARPIQAAMIMTDLISLVAEIVQHVRADASLDQNISIEMNTELASLQIPVDVALFKSALLNLIVNAIQAMPQGGTITVSLGLKGEEAIIKIADTGVGIAPEHLKKLFSPFFTTKVTGNGFGLAEVDQVIRAHGGVIEVDSVLNQGTVFTIKLPQKPFF